MPTATRRLVLLVLLVLLLLIPACGEDEPTRPPAPTMVSEVGEFVSDLTFDGGYPDAAIYRYDGVLFEGDLELAAWGQFKDALADRLGPEEHFYKVYNFLVYPEEFHEQGVMVLTCTDATAGGCQGGGAWSFAESTDGWGIIFEGSWQVGP